MSEDYLWDGSGEPDPVVAHLEDVLKDLRWSKKELDWRHSRPSNRRPVNRPFWLAAAAAVVLGLATAAFVHKTPASSPLTSWKLSLPGQAPHSISSGQVIETGARRATIESESIGEVDIDPDSRLRLLADTHRDQHRLALDHGTIHAFIWAAPTKFVVDTPAAKTVDLGCRYTLSVAQDGSGFLTVQLGWVAFQWNKIESFIPRGAACTTRVGYGPDTPYFLDAPVLLTKSLAEFEMTGNEQALRLLLKAARPRDALTLWHLLERTQDQERGEVFDRFAGLVNLPSGVTREAILRGDRPSMDAAWNALQFGDTGWWREWKRDW